MYTPYIDLCIYRNIGHDKYVYVLYYVRSLVRPLKTIIRLYMDINHFTQLIASSDSCPRVDVNCRRKRYVVLLGAGSIHDVA